MKTLTDNDKARQIINSWIEEIADEVAAEPAVINAMPDALIEHGLERMGVDHQGFYQRIQRRIQNNELLLSDFIPAPKTETARTDKSESGVEQAQKVKLEFTLHYRYDKRRILKLKLDRFLAKNSDGYCAQTLDSEFDHTPIRVNEKTTIVFKGYGGVKLTAPELRGIGQTLNLSELIHWGDDRGNNVGVFIRKLNAARQALHAALQNLTDKTKTLPAIDPSAYFYPGDQMQGLNQCFNGGWLLPTPQGMGLARRDGVAASKEADQQPTITLSDEQLKALLLPLMIEISDHESEQGAQFTLTWLNKLRKQLITLRPDKAPELFLVCDGKPKQVSPEWTWSQNESVKNTVRLKGFKVNPQWLFAWYWEAENNRLVLAFQTS